MKIVICELILIFLTNFWCDFYGCNLDSRQMVLESSFTINQIIIKDYDLCPGQLSSIQKLPETDKDSKLHFFLYFIGHTFSGSCAKLQRSAVATVISNGGDKHGGLGAIGRGF